ncbi:hypothetical protein [Rummeliibacillus suwonensis]|uniref:hypothetical protein n=1 Tax=Rummeliibacillus suwonensis TaxID=1306154 RepID=UPI00289AB174|nr:hypothetical protein [Rummeliibacillus suwonensis]
MSIEERKKMWQERIEAYKSSGETSIKSWCAKNEWYAKDTSKKIKAVFKAKGESGKPL